MLLLRPYGDRTGFRWILDVRAAPEGQAGVPERSKGLGLGPSA